MEKNPIIQLNKFVSLYWELWEYFFVKIKVCCSYKDRVENMLSSGNSLTAWEAVKSMIGMHFPMWIIKVSLILEICSGQKTETTFKD